VVIGQPQLVGGCDVEIPQPSGVQANRPNLLLDGSAGVAESIVIEVASTAIVLNAFGLTLGTSLQAYSTLRRNGAEIAQPFLYAAQPIVLTESNNATKLDRSGRYVFKVSGPSDGVLLVATPSIDSGSATQ